MTLTQSCDVYLALHDAGVNRVLTHVFRQRPSLVNYATAGLARQPERLCRQIDAHPVVVLRKNPLVGILPPLPVALTSYAVDYSFQLSAARLDISPGDAITLPPELAPLAEQRIAFQAGACFGYGCPPKDLVDHLPPPVTRGDRLDPRLDPRLDRRVDRRVDRGDVLVDRLDRLDQLHLPPGRGDQRVQVIPSRELLCTCLDLFAVLGTDFTGTPGAQHFVGLLDGIEIVDLAPTPLEDSIECYLGLVTRLGVLPRLRVPAITLTQQLADLFKLTVEPTDTPEKVPHNPALEENQVKVFLDIAVTPPGPPPPSPPPTPPGPPEPPAPPRGTPVARTRSGPFDATVALSQGAVTELFNGVKSGFRILKSDSRDFGTFSFSYSVDGHLENGTLDLRSDGTIRLSELDLAWDTLRVCMGIDIPELCLGGFCIIPNPFGGCILRAPRLCAFSSDPDISFCLDVAPFVRSELSATLRPVILYGRDPLRTAAMNDWDAFDAKVLNEWQLYVDPSGIDFDLFDIADIVGDLLDDAIDAAIDTLLGPLPGWFKDLLKAVLGPLVDVVRAILDFGDDLSEWISDTLGVQLGLFDFVVNLLADFLARGKSLFVVPDPFPAIKDDGSGLIPVLIPLQYLSVQVTDDEMVVGVDVGD